MITKLKWKKKWLDDKSGYWYSAKVPVLGWEYIVDVNNVSRGYDQCPSEHNEKVEYECYVFLSSKSTEDNKISKKILKTKEAAINVCENHLNNVAKKFDKWFKLK